MVAVDLLIDVYRVIADFSAASRGLMFRASPNTIAKNRTFSATVSIDRDTRARGIPQYSLTALRRSLFHCIVSLSFVSSISAFN